MRIIFQTGTLLVSTEKSTSISESSSISGQDAASTRSSVVPETQSSSSNDLKGRYLRLPEIVIHLDKKSYYEMLLLVKESLRQRLVNIASILPGTEEQRLFAASRMLCDESIVVINSFFKNKTVFQSGNITDDDIELIRKFIHLENLQDMFPNLPLRCKILLPIEYKHVTDKQEDLCMSCVENSASVTCSGCRFARYCSKYCQTNHWKCHKPECKKSSSESEV